MEVVTHLISISLACCLALAMILALLHYLALRGFAVPPPKRSAGADTLLFIVLNFAYALLCLGMVISVGANPEASQSNLHAMWTVVHWILGMVAITLGVFLLPDHVRRNLLRQRGIAGVAVVDNVVTRGNKYGSFYRTTLIVQQAPTRLTKEVILFQPLALGERIPIMQLPERPDVFELLNKDLKMRYHE